MPSSKLCAVLILIALLSPVVQSFAATGDERQLLDCDYSGSSPSARVYRRIMPSNAVQSLLLQVADAPRDRAFIDEALKGTGVTTDTLQAIGLIRPDGSRFCIAFSLLTQADRKTILAAAEREGKYLAALVLEQRTAIEALLKANEVPGVDWRAMGYFIVGCTSLDWDGLNMVERRGILASPAKGEYLPIAVEIVPREEVRALYWGSHNYHDEIAVTTFGDHCSLPRTGLPDLFWNVSMEAPKDVSAKANRAAEGLVRRHAAAIMIELRDGPKSSNQLSAATGFSGNDVADILGLLLSLNYVVASDSMYHTVIPVITERDTTLVTELRLIGQRILNKWADERYKLLHEELSMLTPQRYGVPLPNSFYWIWHYIFGVANRNLVTAGLFADPYDASRKFKGFIPAVYELGVVQRPL
jgi:hypothetical protein